MEEKKVFVDPEYELRLFSVNDVIRASVDPTDTTAETTDYGIELPFDPLG